MVKTVLLDNLSDEELKDSFVESKVMERLDHPNIIKFIEVYIASKPRLQMCIVMAYADGGDLQSRIKNQKGKQFSETQILDWFTQICLAIKHMHDRKILHRDLKSQNIFLTQNGLIKLGDFGIAKCLRNTVEKAKTVVGTPYYLSPEIVQNKPYSFKSDIWSLGVLLYEMCALKMPFDGSNIASLSLKIIKGQYNPLPSSYTKDLRALVALMLNVDMSKRPSINEILRQSIIKSRIKNFLSEMEYDKEFSHTIIHKYVNDNLR